MKKSIVDFYMDNSKMIYFIETDTVSMDAYRMMDKRSKRRYKKAVNHWTNYAEIIDCELYESFSGPMYRITSHIPELNINLYEYYTTKRSEYYTTKRSVKEA